MYTSTCKLMMTISTCTCRKLLSPVHFNLMLICLSAYLQKLMIGIKPFLFMKWEKNVNGTHVHVHVVAISED